MMDRKPDGEHLSSAAGSRLPGFGRITKGTNFYFLRHGESEGNTGGIVQGRKEYGLSESGERHAAGAGEWFRGRGIDLVVSSPLLRSLRTADIVARTAELPQPVTEEFLTELDTGPFTGLTFSEIASRYPEEWKRFRELSWEGVAGAETIKEISTRACRYWEKLITLAEDGSRNILCVTHSGFLQWLLKTAMGGSMAWMPLFSIANCGIFLLFVSPPHMEDPVARADERSFYAQWKLMNHVPCTL